MSQIIIPRAHQAAPKGEVLPVGSIVNISELEMHEAKIAKLEQWIASTVGHAVTKQYQNRQWRISVDVPNRMVIVVCPSLSGTKGYHVHISNRTMEEIVNACVMGAGEILERHGMSRRQFANPEVFEVVPRDVRGDVVANDAKAEPIARLGSSFAKADKQ